MFKSHILLPRILLLLIHWKIVLWNWKNNNNHLDSWNTSMINYLLVGFTNTKIILVLKVSCINSFILKTLPMLRSG